MRAQDARAASIAGADAVGMIFHPASRRNITLQTAQQIIDALTAFVTPVAVFVDAELSDIRQITGALKITHVQLNGDEPPETVQALSPLRVIKAIKVDPATFTATLAKWRQAVKALALSNLSGLVLEPSHTGVPGGSGVANDWSTILSAQRAGAFEFLGAIIAAGGLTPQSVSAVVRAIHPYAVDVSSGVESSPGIKSAQRIAAFIRAARMDPRQAPGADLTHPNHDD